MLLRAVKKGAGTRLFGIADRVRSHPAEAWGLTAAAFMAALLARFGTDHLLPPGFPYLTFFPAVILTTFFAGVRPGAACAAACGLAAWYWFIPPFGAFTLNASVLVALAFYVCVVGVDIVLIQVMHDAVDKFREERGRTRELLLKQDVLLADQRERQRQQRVLQRELSHRMKNTLAMVQAVVSQSLRNVSDPRLAAELASSRIQALARAQDALTATDWAAADVETVVRTALEPHRDGVDRFTVSGPPTELDAQRTLGLALAIHELATNATKYGALSNGTGSVDVDWNVSSDGRFLFRWIESGGPPVVDPDRRGFGSRLTERVVPGYFAGSASTRFRPSGIAYELDGTVGGSLRNHA